MYRYDPGTAYRSGGVTERSVKRHERALSIRWGQLTDIPDSLGDALAYEDRLSALENQVAHLESLLEDLGDAPAPGSLTGEPSVWTQPSSSSRHESAAELASLLHPDSAYMVPTEGEDRWWTIFRQTSSLGRGVLKIPSAGFSHLDLRLSFRNAVDSSYRTWGVLTSTNGVSYSTLTSVSGAVGTHSTGDLRVPVTGPYLYLRWSQTSGWDENSASHLVGLSDLEVTPRVIFSGLKPVL